MTARCLRTAGLRFAALREIPGFRSDIATSLDRAAFGADANSDLAEAIEMLREWLDEGKSRLDSALKLADSDARDADADFAERIVLAAE